MGAKGTKENHFEEHIVDYLTQEVEEYHQLDRSSYDKKLLLIPGEVVQFVIDTQPKKYKKLQEQYGNRVDEVIAEAVSRHINQQKTLKVLRGEVRVGGEKIKMLYFKPSTNKTPEHEEWYRKNRMAVIRQLNYSTKNNNSIDLVFFVNGIPVVTVELKNVLTGQNHHNAIKQYVQDRDPKGEAFLEFQRCLVHFAAGTEKIFMTTYLKGKSTFFLPFNKSLDNSNPDGFATSYLWEDVLQKDSLLDLLQNYINLQIDKEKVYDPKSGGLKEIESKKLIFPRWHQRRAVQSLIDKLRKDGTGKNYLVQHSAGSGKSNTITWLAYKLANFYQNPTDRRSMYDSVFVVTDRKVLNTQLQKNIRQLDKTSGMIAYLGDNSSSQDLKNAIEDRKKIIITTIQKFRIISDLVQNYKDRNYAILIDEAHSSQSGEVARHMRKALSLEQAAKEEGDNSDIDDIITAEIMRKGQQPNISQFAFTATPKDKTVQLFGTEIDGEKKAFDTYSMEQAIKEGFIRDVLENYMSFKRYYKLLKKGDIDDKEYDKKKTVRVLNNYVDLQDHAIEIKAKIMLEHFAAETQDKIEGRARAMLVTKSRLHAVRFKRKFDDIMRDMKLPYEALVAFSGTVHDEETGEDYTETSMNGLEGKFLIEEAFKLPKYRILIVANKFQTGFDEPLLHTMFVDKKLGGPNTVQTLSRLNRTTRGKEGTMVLDFVNDPEQVQEDFQKYYGKNYIKIENLTDANELYYKLNEVENYDLIYDQEVEKFAEIFFSEEDNFEKLQPILQEVSRRFEDQLEDEDQSGFKSVARSFVRLYRFLSQIMTFTDVELEKKYVFLTALLKVLPYVKQDLPLDVVNDVELDSYKVQHSYTTKLKLESENGEMQGVSANGGGGSKDEDLDMLSKIIKTLNETYGLDLTEEDKIDFKKVKDNIYSNEDLMSFFNSGNSKANIKDKFDGEIDDELLKFIDKKLEFYNKMTDDKSNALFKAMLFNDIYDRKVRRMKI